MLNYHDKFSIKIKAIQDKLMTLMAPKFDEPEEFHEDLKIEKIEILSDEENPQPRQRIDIKSFECDVCSKSFVNKLAFKVHRKMHTLTKTQDDFMCERCGETFLTLSAFSSHKRRCARENVFGPFPCPFEGCTRILEDHEKLRKHKRYHAVVKSCSKAKKIPCHECGKEFAPGYKMNRHMKLHTKIKEHACPCCSSRYTQRYNLLAHIKQHHVNVFSESAEPNSRSYTFICDLCSDNFSKVDSFRNHYEQVHHIYQASTS